MFRSYSLIYRYSTFPHDQACGNSGEEKLQRDLEAEKREREQSKEGPVTMNLAAQRRKSVSPSEM